MKSKKNTIHFKNMEQKANGRIGLANLSDTCYINVIIQCLRYCPDLTEYFLKEQYKEHLKGDRKPAKLVHEFADVISSMWKADVRLGASMSPKGFIHVASLLANDPTYNFTYQTLTGTQEDSSELLYFVLDSIHNALARKVKMDIIGKPKTPLDELHIKALEAWSAFYTKEFSVVIDTFFWQMQRTTVCSKCNNKTYRWEPNMAIKGGLSGSDQDIQSCIHNAFAEEKISDYHCLNCEKNGDPKNVLATITSSISYLPSNIIIHLKRFENSGKKIRSNVSVNLEALNLSPWIAFPGVTRNKNTVYTTYAVVKHLGSTPRSGHYTSYVRHGDGWICYDDTSIRKVDSSEVINSDTYILFLTNKPYKQPDINWPQ
jgi:ubiquitin C-terminal hydrolase